MKADKEGHLCEAWKRQDVTPSTTHESPYISENSGC